MHFKQKTYRLISLILAFVVFASSLSFGMDMHYCQGTLKSVSFSGKAKTCHEMTPAKQMKACQHKMAMQNFTTESCDEDKGNCCDNKFFEYDLDQNQQIQNFDFETNKLNQHFAVAFISSFLLGEINLDFQEAFVRHKPPLIPRDIPVFIQSFLL